MQPIQDPWQPVDPLGQALYFLRMSGAFYCRSELTARWGLTVPAIADYMWFHVITQGRGWLDADGAEAHLLHPGQFALVPHGLGHRLWSEPGVPTPGVLDLEREQVSAHYEILRHGEGGAQTTLICGAVRFKHPAARAILEALPKILVIDASQSPQMQWMQSTLQLMAAEARQMHTGGEAVITRLGDILVIQAIRAWIASDPAAAKGWLGALQDPKIGRAIVRIHRDPAHPWTVAALASEAGMSRSAFAARFTERVGVPVMQYVTRWRMYVAVDVLSEEDATVAELTDRLGYRSEAAFSRAFKRIIGDSPGAIRRNGIPSWGSRL
jgi:AraC-like DNA-binding protein